MQILDEVFLGNTIRQILIAIAIICLTYVFRRFSSKLLTSALFKTFGKDSKGFYAEFIRLVVPAIQGLVFSAGCYFAVQFLNITTKLNLVDDKIINLNLVINHTLYLILIWRFMVILYRLTDFFSFIQTEKAALTESKFDDQLVPFVKDVVKVLVTLFGFLFILGIVFNFNITAILGGLGLGGLAIALAAQDTLGNLFGSFTVFTDKPFMVGDLIDHKGIVGTVEKVGFRSTRIRTLDKSYVTVPNKDLVTNPLTNITESTHRRARFLIGVVYSTKPATLKKIVSEIKEYLLCHPETNDNPLVRFFEYGDSSLNILVTYLVNTADYDFYAAVMEEVNYKIYEIVEANGSSFAYPSSSLYLETSLPQSEMQLKLQEMQMQLTEREMNSKKEVKSTESVPSSKEKNDNA
jgi:MscS family membrane protein